jgi:hypothetical protein
MMRILNPIIAVLWLCVTLQAIEVEADDFSCQTITLPAKAMRTRFADLNGGGRFDLLAVDSMGKQLLIYRQRAAGFTNTPDQIIELPPHTAWIAPAHVEARTNFDLLISTATGLVYCRQDGGAFEPEPRVLLKANQVFSGDDSPILLPVFTNRAIPVISATQAWFYPLPGGRGSVSSAVHRNNKLEGASNPPMFLNAENGTWSSDRNRWSLGPDSSRMLEVNRSFLSMPRTDTSYKPENDGIAKLTASLKEKGMAPESTEVDLDGDGQKDLVLWQAAIQSFRTDLYIFLRGADGRLPERPTQILHCRGVPIPVNSTWTWSPIADLKGDGKYELVLVDRDFIITSIGSLVDMALTRGVKFALTVRSFSHGAFARSGDTAVSFKTQLSLYGSWQWPFFICGDFNGDGHPDFVATRPDGQWGIYYSTSDDHWFQPQPALTFELPAQGYFERRYFEISDLNGDGRSDIVSHDLDDTHIFILLTQRENPKGNP